MAVTETLKALGSWSLNLKPTIPIDTWSKIGYFGHIVIHTGRINPKVDADGLLDTSRYTGVVRVKNFDGTTHVLGGPGMAMWLGDEDKKGDVVESLLTIDSETFENSIRAALPASGSVTEGTLFNIGGDPFSATFQYLSPREIIDYICTTMGADWVVRGDGTLDAGLESDLFVTVPKAAILRRNGGVDRLLRAYEGKISADQDVEDFTTRVLLLAAGSEGSTSTGSADILPGLNPYKDIHGNFIKMTRIVSESSTDPGNAEARAQLQLNRFTSPRDALRLSTAEYDVKGDVAVGDYLWVYDPESDLVADNEVIFRGLRLYPIKLRLTEMTWPVRTGMSVAYRDINGAWTDLTPYVTWETGETTLVVGGYNRSLTSGADGGVAGSRPVPNTTIPGVVSWVEPFQNSVYQSQVTGETKAQVLLRWLRPTNTDSTTIIDGDYYQIRWRTSTTPLFPVTWRQAEIKTWRQIYDEGGTWAHPFQYPAVDWQYATAPWDVLQFMLQELAPNMPYEAQIRAVDNGTPANVGDWSDVAVFQTSGDTLPPATPAPISSVAASTLAVQITHELGRSDGGTFNLDLDLHHLEVHGEYEPNFTPNANTLIGKIIANRGMLAANVPAVATFPIDQLNPTYFKVVAVDNDGNKSLASTAVQATALLVDDAHITSLTVSKVTAGTITADWIVAAYIKTGASPNPWTGLTPFGFEGWAAGGVSTFWVDSGSGNVWMKGQLRTGEDSDSRIIINPGQNNPRIVFYPNPGFGDHVDMIVTSYSDPRGIGNTGIKIAAVDSSGNSKGGELEFGQTGVKMGHFNSGTGQWAYYWIDEQSRHALRGTFNTNNYDPWAALCIGETFVTASGDGGLTYTYGMTFASAMRIVGTTEIAPSVSGTQYAHMLTSGTHSSGFSANWILNAGSFSAPEAPGKMFFWAYRV